MRTLYLDIFSGISGDMFLGALVDLGVDPRLLEQELGRLKLGGYHLHVGRAERGQIAGTRFDVHVDAHAAATGEEASHSHPHSHAHPGHGPQDHAHDHGHDCGHSHSHSHSHANDQGHDHEHGGPEDHSHGRDHSQIRELIRRSELSAWVKTRALAVFQRIAVAEGKIHGKPPASVHFHEVGAVDSIVDIVGACIALEMLGCPQVMAGPVVDGTGFVRCAHGRFPLPAPATLEILGARGVRVQQTDEPNELITPTGAGLLAEFAESFGPIPGIKIDRIGYGLGSRENRTRPNVLRAILGTAGENGVHDWERDEVTVLETNLDDVSAEVLGNVFERTLAAGALDVFHTSIHMKKSRPGVLLSVICLPADADRFTELLLRETSAFGVRRTTWERRKLKREIRTAKTSLGEIQVKLGWLDGRLIQVAPEYESCKIAAERANTPLREVYDVARRAFL